MRRCGSRGGWVSREGGKRVWWVVVVVVVVVVGSGDVEGSVCRRV